jgi:hypothetical protein
MLGAYRRDIGIRRHPAGFVGSSWRPRKPTPKLSSSTRLRCLRRTAEERAAPRPDSTTGTAMQTIRLTFITLGLTVLASTATAAPRCDAPRDQADRTACAKAAESPSALRQYVERTRAIHQLYYWDYTTPEQVERQHARAAEARQRLAARD